VPRDTRIVTKKDPHVAAGKPDGGGTGYVVIYTYTTPLFYLKNHVTMPTDVSWEVIFDPAYKGKLFMTSNYDSLLFPLAKMLNLDVATDNLDPLWKKLATLRPNIKVVGDDTPFIENMKTGEVWLGSALVGDAFALKADGVNVAWTVPKEGATLTGDAMYLPKNLPDDVAYYAQMFINEVIDAQMQTQWTAKVQTVPTNSNSEPASFMKDDPAFPFSQAQIDKYAIVQPVKLSAEHTDEWQAKWTAAIQS
jgi:putative spermidine/putrescine transport system substrate-binding protein